MILDRDDMKRHQCISSRCRDSFPGTPPRATASRSLGKTVHCPRAWRAAGNTLADSSGNRISQTESGNTMDSLARGDLASVVMKCRPNVRCQALTPNSWICSGPCGRMAGRPKRRPPAEMAVKSYVPFSPFLGLTIRVGHATQPHRPAATHSLAHGKVILDRS